MTFDEYIDGEVRGMLKRNDVQPDDKITITGEGMAKLNALGELLRHAVESGQITLPNKE